LKGRTGEESDGAIFVLKYSYSCYNLEEYDAPYQVTFFTAILVLGLVHCRQNHCSFRKLLKLGPCIW
jgi:hypothetical protein